MPPESHSSADTLWENMTSPEEEASRPVLGRATVQELPQGPGECRALFHSWIETLYLSVDKPECAFPYTFTSCTPPGGRAVEVRQIEKVPTTSAKQVPNSRIPT